MLIRDDLHPWDRAAQYCYGSHGCGGYRSQVPLTGSDGIARRQQSAVPWRRCAPLKETNTALASLIQLINYHLYKCGRGWLNRLVTWNQCYGGWDWFNWHSGCVDVINPSKWFRLLINGFDFRPVARYSLKSCCDELPFRDLSLCLVSDRDSERMWGRLIDSSILAHDSWRWCLEFMLICIHFFDLI